VASTTWAALSRQFRREKTNTTMNTLDEIELMQVEGGIAQGIIGAGLTAYIGFLREVEANPQYYTWTMDWYYQR
jgi:hypothetical protein